MRITRGILITLTSIAAPVFAVDNDQFAAELAGTKPVLWKDYEPLYHDFIGCIAGVEPARLTQSVCERIDKSRARMFWDALKQAVLLNAASREGPKFCTKHVTEIVAQQKTADGTAIAVYMIDIQLHGGAGPYGTDLPATYLGKIVFDALVKISPCTQ
jgi:hypothetical protein